MIRARDRLSSANAPRNITQDFEIFNGSIDWRVAGQRLVYVVNHAVQHLQSQEVADRGDLFGPTYGASLQNYGQFSDTNGVQQSHELRLQSDERLFGMVDYVVGGLINKLDSPTTLSIPTPAFCLGNIPGQFLPSPPFPAGTPLPCAFTPLGNYPAPSSLLAFSTTPISTRSTTLEHSIFGNLTLHFGEKTELSGGARYIMYQDRGNTFVGPQQIRQRAPDGP